jgi:hypothetical protein
VRNQVEDPVQARSTNGSRSHARRSTSRIAQRLGGVLLTTLPLAIADFKNRIELRDPQNLPHLRIWIGKRQIDPGSL